MADREVALWVEFIDEAHQGDSTNALTFGRQATIVLDESNSYMHRQAGDFVCSDGSWWLRNQSKATEFSITALSGQRVVVPPGTAHLLSAPRGVVQFQFGLGSYELEWRLEGGPVAPDSVAPSSVGGVTTHTFGVIGINDEQRLMLAALCEPRLNDPDARNLPLPPNQDIARRLDWTLRKFDRKLDYVCRRLADTGVPGLRGEPGVEAFDRRTHLVEHMVGIRAITVADLDLLP